MTATKPTEWARCDIAVARRDHAEEWIATPTPGRRSGNVGVYRDPDTASSPWTTPWRMVHQPSGIPFAAFRTLRGATEFLRAFRERFQPDILDRAAAGDLGDWRTISQIRALSRQFETT